MSLRQVLTSRFLSRLPAACRSAFGSTHGAAEGRLPWSLSMLQTRCAFCAQCQGNCRVRVAAKFHENVSKSKPLRDDHKRMMCSYTLAEQRAGEKFQKLLFPLSIGSEAPYTMLVPMAGQGELVVSPFWPATRHQPRCD